MTNQPLPNFSRTLFISISASYLRNLLKFESMYRLEDLTATRASLTILLTLLSNSFYLNSFLRTY